MSTHSDLMALLGPLERIAKVLERAFPAAPAVTFDARHIAFVWEQQQVNGQLQSVLTAVEEPSLIAFADLHNVDRQRQLIERNTRQFVAGRPANNMLLTGARGTGKSSLVRACLHAFHEQGLRLIEVDKAHLVDLPKIMTLIRERPERFIIFCDDLSFEEGETGYKMLKTVLDGSISGPGGNVLIYATSNRRHLLPQQMQDNLGAAPLENGEINPGEAVEEKVSLSERFGLWVGFYPFSQDEYLTAVGQWLCHYGLPASALEEARQEAIRWAAQRGSRSGRVAAQFARDYAGRQPL